MGYELNRLMKQYGVATPTMGSAPQMPGAAPVESAYTGKAGSPGDAAKYAADKAAFDESVRKYGVDKQAYDDYAKAYQDRLQTVPMYGQQQYSTVFAPTSSTPIESVVRNAYQQYGRGQGFGTGMNQMDLPGYNYWLQTAKEQNLSPQQLDKTIREAADKYMTDNPADQWTKYIKGVQNLRNTGSFYDDVLRAPTYSASSPVATGTPVTTTPVTTKPTTTVTPVVKSQSTINQALIDEIQARPGSTYSDLLNAAQNLNVTPDQFNTAWANKGFTDIGLQDTNQDSVINAQDLSTQNIATALGAELSARPGSSYQDLMNMATNVYGMTPEQFQAGWNAYNAPYQLAAKGGYIKHYNTGGAVKGYQTGGMKDPLTGVTTYAVPMMPELQIQELEPISTPTMRTEIPPVVSDVYPDEAQRGSRAGAVYVPAGDATATRSIAAAAPATARAAPTDDRMLALQTMLAQYGPQNIDYGSQITTARASQKAEQKAFEDMLRKQLASPEDAASSRAEMYFRLASAFGSPTKTGHFTENLSLAGKEMAESAKNQRADRAKKLGIQLELQKMKMEGANKEVDTLRALQAETMKDRRAIAQEMIKEYIASGKAQSTAGKMAQDMGLTPGTPEYQKKVEELSILEVQKQTALINAQLASIAAQQKRGEQMSPAELALRVETESNLDNVKTALDAIKDAYARNPNSYDGSLIDATQKKIYETFGSDDPKVINTQIIDNLLGQQGLASLKTTFGGNPTEGERKILLELQGIGAKSRAQRGEIMMRLYAVLKEREKRNQTRLNDIISGRYRTYDTSVGGQQ